MRSETQPYSNWLCRTAHAIFSQNFGTIKRILPGSSSPSHRKDPGTEVGLATLKYPQQSYLAGKTSLVHKPTYEFLNEHLNFATKSGMLL